VTLRMMARPGRIRGVGSIFGVLRNVLPGDTADTVGKIRLLTGQPEGDGAPCWKQNTACALYKEPCLLLSKKKLPKETLRMLFEGTLPALLRFMPSCEDCV
jgi:hypothetical protein